ncbi:MAG: LOG family protein [Ktedonobacteraceae bacterium]
MNDSEIKHVLEVGVMGSASLSEGDPRWTQAHRLGTLLAQEGFAIVTGGYAGLMSAVSQGAHEAGGRVAGLPMRHWTNVQPNSWNAELRWSVNYGERINHILHCNAIIALPGGVGTLSEMALVWATIQTEPRSQPLILFGECWPPVIEAIRANLVVGDHDLRLLRFATSPEEAIRELHAGLREDRRSGHGPRG